MQKERFFFCANCGGAGHKRDSCKKDTVCKNCGGAHLATDKSKCKVYKFNESIKKLMAVENLSFKEAYKKVSSNSKRSVKPKSSAKNVNSGYAAAVATVHGAPVPASGSSVPVVTNSERQGG